jgi:acyl carrier protein phosphodiesterase
MNFLGHLYLSGDDPLVIVGNFMADSVKGRDLSRHPEAVQRGIVMHRTIDVFTDQHPITLAGRERLRAHAGKYAGVALDVFYDHVLAANWAALHPEPLADFTGRMYALLQAHQHLMPEATRHMLPYMVRYDWLTSYARIEGIGRALEGLSRRVPAGAALSGAERVLEAHYADYRAEGLAFVAELERQLRTQAA